MEIALQAAERNADLPGQGHVLRSLAGASFDLSLCKTRPCITLSEHRASIRHLATPPSTPICIAISVRFIRIRASLQLAIEHNLKALELYRKAGYRRGEARAIADIGEAHSALGDYEEAVSCLDHGITLAQEVGKPHQEGKVRKDLGIVCSKLGQQDKAAEQFKQALVLILLR